MKCSLKTSRIATDSSFTAKSWWYMAKTMCVFFLSVFEGEGGNVFVFVSFVFPFTKGCIARKNVHRN